MAFMRPEITDKQEWAGIETTAGYWWVPFNVLSKTEAEAARRGDFSLLLKYADSGSRVIDSLSTIKKGYGVRLSAPGYMDATEWEVYGSEKEARTRAKELIEEEDEEGTLAPGHATIAHAKKKSKAQLNREIAEALAGKGTSRGTHHSSISDSAKIRNAVARFPSTFGLRGFPGDVFRISPTASYVSGERVMLYTERKDNGAWQDFSKGTEAELRREVTSTGGMAHSTKSKKRSSSQARVVGKHGLGTADVRTGEGAYWIVTGPTGYRVDYKPWGPSNEVDLGTFPSRKQARAKISAHAGSIGATIVS